MRLFGLNERSLSRACRGGVIGLDLGACSIKAVQMRGRGDLRQVAATLVLPRQRRDGALTLEQARRLREVLDRRGFTGRRVVVSVPSSSTLTSVLDVPPRSSGAPVDTIARAEMARAHRQEAGEIEVAFWELPEPARKSESMQIMAAACRHDDADALILPLQGAGFEVMALDVGGWAVARSLGSKFAEANRLTAAIDIGWQASTFVLLHEGMLVYERHLDGCGMSTVSEAAAEQLGVDETVVDYLLYKVGFDASRCQCEEDRQLADKLDRQLSGHFKALADELRLSLSYAGHQYPGMMMDEVLMHGGGASVPGLSTKLTGWLDRPARVVTAGELAGGGEWMGEDAASPSLAVAMGLAIYKRREAAA